MARLAPSLVRARNAVDLRWPHRDRASDGWIGDAAHAGRTSDHNPNERGIVCALDIDTVGGETPVHVPSVVAGLMMHGATHYVIHDRRIYLAADHFKPRAYNGINPHTGHAHASIFQAEWAEQTPEHWWILESFPEWPMFLRRGSTGGAVRELQAYLNAWGGSLVVDGDFGPRTEAGVAAFQDAHRIKVDGIVGPQTRGELFG